MTEGVERLDLEGMRERAMRSPVGDLPMEALGRDVLALLAELHRVRDESLWYQRWRKEAETSRFLKQVLDRAEAEVARLTAEREQVREALRKLAANVGLVLDPPHDPEEWHGGMVENIATCQTCYVNAALATPDSVAEEAR